MRLNQKGQSLVEYLVIVALVGISSIAIMKAVGNNVSVQFAQIAKALGGDVDGNPQAAKITQTMYEKKDLKNFFKGSLNRAENGRGGGDSSDTATPFAP